MSEEFTSNARRRGINLALVGDHLHALYNDPTQQAYLALVTGDKTRTIRHNRTNLMAALRPHTISTNNEIVFRDSKIVLNIDEAIHDPFFITLTPRKLFGYCGHGKLQRHHYT
jgi:hypothetical protein